MEKEPFRVLYEDNHLIIVDKSSGILTQGDETGDTPLSEMVKDYIKVKYNKPGNVFCGVVHRLDRPVSGVVILARTSKALERLNKMFQNREVKKTYWGLVKEKPPMEEETIVHWLDKDKNRNVTTAYTRPKGAAKKSELTYRILAKVNKYYLLEVKPSTGRPHQIRTQLAKIGCPIKGDIKYGYPEKNKDGRIHLHSRKVEFTHPVKKDPMTFSTRVPAKDQVWRDFAHIEA